MAQLNSEQYREQTGHPHEKAGDFAAEEGKAGEQNFDLNESGALRETPSSGVGYGGGDDIYYETPNTPGMLGHWESGSRNEDESRYGKDIRASDSSGTVDQRGGTSSYGTVNPNARPSEAGFGSSGLGGYPDEGDSNMGSVGDASSRQSGNYGREGITDESSVYGSEVRGGVRHGVTSEGVSSGAGVTDGFGGSTPTSSDVERHRYHRTEVAPSQQKDTPYSQMLTELDGPSEGSRDRFQEEEGITGNTKGGTAVDHQKEARKGADQSESEGFLKKLMHKLPGNDH